MPSLVEQLITETIGPTVSIPDLLLKVKVVASRLGLTDPIQWVDHELNGYGDVDRDAIPAYRNIRGVAKALNPVRGWLRIEFLDHDLEDRISSQRTDQPISSLQEMSRGSGALSFIAPPALSAGLQNGTDARIFVDRSQISDVLSAVRNRVLDWALALETAGVLGNGLSFTLEERTRATTVNYNIQGPVGVIGVVQGGAVTQNVGLQDLTGLITALEGLISAAAAEQTGAAVIAVVQQTVEEAKREAPSITALERLLIATASLVQGIAAFSPAWTAVAAVASAYGIHIPLPRSR